LGDYTLVFMTGRFQSLRDRGRHPSTKFKRNWTARGWVIDKRFSTFWPSNIMVRAQTAWRLSGMYGPTCTTFGMMMMMMMMCN